MRKYLRRSHQPLLECAGPVADTCRGTQCADAGVAASTGLVELSPTPPNITQAVPPNIMVTFDDSGSMASDYMGDRRPYDGGDWGGPWKCAGVIDASETDTSSLRSYAMNGVYYNPLVTYKPPIKADGTVMPDADDSLNSGMERRHPEESSAQLRQSGHTDFTGDKNNNTWYCGQGDVRPLGKGGGPVLLALEERCEHRNGGQSQYRTISTTANNWEAVQVPSSAISELG